MNQTILRFCLLNATLAVLLTTIPLMPSLAAQSLVAGDIVGTIVDPSTAVLAGVKVTLKNTTNGETRTTATNSIGVYRFAFVSPGSYVVYVQAAEYLHQFDLAFGVPDPPSFTVLAPLGTVPFDPNNPAQVGWAFETTIDVEWAHATAPGASIVLLTSPVDETNGVQGVPEFLYLEKYALDHDLGTIISQSWGVTENTLFPSQQGLQVFSDFENLYARAVQQHVTVLAAAGDFGTGGPNLTGGFYSFPVVAFPASSPLVTAVGGTSLYTDADGNYLNETVWNSSGTYLLTGSLADAGAGGVSQQSSEPDYQYGLSESVQQLLNRHRGIPDVAYDSDVLTSSFIWVGFFPDLLYDGWYSASGTSEASPQWAGIVAIANQFAGHPLGFLNPKLYALGAASGSEVFHDITFGSNAFPYAGVPGYLATPGWDLASGWGTPKADALVRALAQMKDEGCGNACDEHISESQYHPSEQAATGRVPALGEPANSLNGRLGWQAAVPGQTHAQTPAISNR